MPGGSRLPVQPIRDRRPLSVQVYDRLVETLCKNVQPRETIPPEMELAANLGVSRTVLREALRLLEEDGVIVRGADPRRRQLAPPSSQPPSFNAPLEEMLLGPAPLRVDVIRTELVDTTNWSRVLLGVEEYSQLLCRESLFLLGTTRSPRPWNWCRADDGTLPHKVAAAEAGARHQPRRCSPIWARSSARNVPRPCGGWRRDPPRARAPASTAFPGDISPA